MSEPDKVIDVVEIDKLLHWLDVKTKDSDVKSEGPLAIIQAAEKVPFPSEHDTPEVADARQELAFHEGYVSALAAVAKMLNNSRQTQPGAPVYRAFKGPGDAEMN